MQISIESEVFVCNMLSCVLGPQFLIVKQRLEAQYNSELQKAKTLTEMEIKELTVLLREEAEERLHKAQQR